MPTSPATQSQVTPPKLWSTWAFGIGCSCRARVGAGMANGRADPSEGDQQPLSPSSRLQSPEPSGTPILKSRPSYRASAAFGFGYNGHEPSVPAISLEEKWRGSFRSGSAEFLPNTGNTDAIQEENDLCKWNDNASDYEREQLEKRYGKEDANHRADSELFTQTEPQLGPLNAQHTCSDTPSQQPRRVTTQTWSSLPAFMEVHSEVSEHVHPEAIKSFPPDEVHVTKKAGKNFLTTAESRVDCNSLQNRFVELFQKVVGFNVIEDVKDITDCSHISALKQPIQQIGYLQKKTDELKSQLAEEKRQRQIAAQRLVEERQEAERSSMKRQELWETKLKELQKEKYSLSIRLQELEAETPRKRIVKGGDTVLLTGEELKRLRQDILEQESLIRGYQLENEKAIEKMKQLQVEAKEKAKLMAEENASLASQFANVQFSARQSQNHGAGVSVNSSTKNAGLEAHAKELKQRLENEKLLQIISDLERKIAEMSSTKKSKGEDATKPNPTVDRSVNNVEMFTEQMELAKKVAQQAALISQLEAKVEDQQRLLDSKPQPTGSAPLPLAPENGQASSRKLKLVTEQVSDIRSFYIKKVQDLTRRLEEVGKENSKADWEIAHLRANAIQTSEAKDLRQMKEQISRLRDTIKSQDDTIKALKKKNAELETVKDMGDQNEQDGSVQSSQANVSRHRVKRKPDSSKQRPQTTGSKHDKLELQIEGFSRKLEAAGVSSDVLKTTVLDIVDNLVNLKLHGENPRKDEIKKMEAMEEQNRALEERLKAVTEELTDLQANYSLSPRMLQLNFLKERIEEMEQHHKEKELEWQGILKETKRVYSIEQDTIERKWELALEAKNAEIERFRVELDAILETALKIQAAQLQAIKGGL